MSTHQFLRRWDQDESTTNVDRVSEAEAKILV